MSGLPPSTAPFLFLGVRPEDAAADEYAALLRAAGLDEVLDTTARSGGGALPPVMRRFVETYARPVTGG